MKVLLTNDDGIEADGLQALRRALLDVPEVELAVIAPGRQPLGDGALDHDPPAAVGRRRSTSATGRVGYATDGTPVDCVRFAKLGLIEGFEADVIVAGHQPRREPRRRHHVLGHGRRRARGRRCSACRRSPSRSSRRRASSTSASAASSTSPSPRAFAADVVDRARRRAAARGHAAEHQRPGGRPRRRRGRAPGQADLPRRAQAHRGGRERPAGATGSTATTPATHDEPGTDLAAVAAGRIAVTPLHFDLTDTERHGRARAARPVAAAGARPPKRWSERDGRRPPPRRGAARAGRAPRRSATTSSTTRRSATTSTTRCSASCSSSRRSTPSSSRPTRRPSASAAEPVSALREGPPRAADALAGQRALGRGAASPGSSGCARTWRARASRTPTFDLRLRAEDRRPGDLAALRGRRLRPRRDARQRRGRRGRHPQPAHDRVDPDAHRRRAAACSRCAARSTCRCRTSRR